MWFIIAMFGVIGGYAAEKSNKKVSNISFAIGYGAGAVFMIDRMVISNGQGIMFYVSAIIALGAAILTITHFISFMKKL
jgi:hypothetical protein